LHQARSLLTRQQDASFGIRRQDRQAIRRQVGRRAADALSTILFTFSISPTTVQISKLVKEPYPSHSFPLRVHASPTNSLPPQYLSRINEYIVKLGQSFSFLLSIGQAALSFIEAPLALGTY
jgi:hypothetical protein